LFSGGGVANGCGGDGSGHFRVGCVAIGGGFVGCVANGDCGGGCVANGDVVDGEIYFLQIKIAL
tara:strand:- start:2859 stop:3050 length:192 start_codon:yes stop_codon:yes gene_type:complete